MNNFDFQSRPIPTNEVTSIQVLHTLLRSFDHCMKIVLHLKADVFYWSESPTSIKRHFLVNARKEILSDIEEIIGE